MSSETWLSLIWPVGSGAVVIAVTLLLRRFLYSYIHKLAAKTATCFDDIMVHDTLIASFLWCIWLGIWVGWKIAETPAAWESIENQIIPVLFVALGIYTGTVIIMATLKWYKTEICPKTSSSLDDIVMSFLIIGTPVVAGILGVILILNMLSISNDSLNGWLSQHLASLAFLVILGVTLLLLAVLIVPRIINTAVFNSKAEQTEEELKKRADTLSSVIVTTLQLAIIFVFLLMIITNLDPAINIAPVLTGAGVLGLAVGFGAQSLVKDVIAGLFVIMENQYRRGDVIKIAGVSGVVEEINLRRTILRDMDGVYHVIPNGQIIVASNFTKQKSNINLNIRVSYDTDLEKAIKVINQVGKDLAEDPQWAPSLLSSPRALRIEDLGESSVDIKIVGETKPSRQWDVTGELRLRLKNAFDKEGIEIPWPHTKVYFGNLPPQLQSKDIPADGEKKRPN
jgi:moderate conductance mechanosensitive channel